MDGREDGEEEEELSESDEDDDRAWERIRRKRMAFERRMQELEERQRGTSGSSGCKGTRKISSSKNSTEVT